MGYYELNGVGSDEDNVSQHAIICVGPSYDLNTVSKDAASEAYNLPELLEDSNALISPDRKRKAADSDLFPELRRFLIPYTKGEPDNEYGQVEVETGNGAIDRGNASRTFGLTYRQWLDNKSPLTDVQRRILLSDAIERHPLRIVGPGGSGKTLLMQLLALRSLERARQQNRPLRILYIVHNAAMAESVKQRFAVLDADDPQLQDNERAIDVYTLAEYGREQLNLEHTSVIDPDANEAKLFQLHQVTIALLGAMNEMPDTVENSVLFGSAKTNTELMPVLARLVMSEISVAIKGHGLEGDKRRYIQSERRLSRLHGLINQDERALIFHVYERYHQAVFEELEVLDTDDIAISLLGRLRTPIWELKRRKLAYDFVFVDETQLFNENERRVLPLLTNGSKSHVPIVLALDEAQDIYGQSTAGMATLGIPDIASENLSSIHRSTRAIVRLAFFVIQRSTDLFGPDFPDFTGIAQYMEPDTHPYAAPPRIDVVNEESRSLGKFLVKRIRELRKANLRRIAVICHADLYWDMTLKELVNTDLPLQTVLTRGEKITADQPIVVLTKPLYAGGQEFDAVILVGLEQGVVPPRVIDNDALSSAIEQQSLREIYLSITRARYRLIVVLTSGSSPTAIFQEAERSGLLVRA
jgi:superfamily I DNA/RNA helicase